MRLISYLFTITILLFSCGGSENNHESESQLEEETTTDLTSEEAEAESSTSTNVMNPRTYGGEKSEAQMFIDQQLPAAENKSEKYLGCYVGDFGPNMINITLYEMTDGIAEGYSVCAGNFRKIQGTYQEAADGHFDFVMEEPGDDQYDGKFEFTLNTENKDLVGKWTPFKSKGNSPKTYTLSKRTFKYDPTIGKYPEASQRELTDDDLSNMMEEELTEMRNEIYARHGYSFKNKEWRYHFEEKDWYMPMGIDIRDKLSDIEAINIELIYQYESYFEDYYDDYGR